VRENLNIDEIEEILKEDPQQLMKTVVKLKHQAILAFNKAPLNLKPRDSKKPLVVIHFKK